MGVRCSTAQHSTAQPLPSRTHDARTYRYTVWWQHSSPTAPTRAYSCTLRQLRAYVRRCAAHTRVRTVHRCWRRSGGWGTTATTGYSPPRVSSRRIGCGGPACPSSYAHAPPCDAHTARVYMCGASHRECVSLQTLVAGCTLCASRTEPALSVSSGQRCSSPHHHRATPCTGHTAPPPCRCPVGTPYHVVGCTLPPASVRYDTTPRANKVTYSVSTRRTADGRTAECTGRHSVRARGREGSS